MRTKHLAGKAVVITGAGQGIGAAYARGAAEAGAQVVVNDINAASAEEVARTIEAAGGTAVTHVADISSWEESGGLIDACVARFGRIDGLVNNGAMYYMAQITDDDPQRVRRMMEVNVLGTLYPGLHALRRMLTQGSGSLVNVASGSIAGIPGVGAYGASKGAVASLTWCWAAEVASTKVRVNAISPMGSTSLSEKTDAYMRAQGKSVSARVQIPPESNAPVVNFLLSDLSDGIHGQLVRVQGRSIGLMAHPAVLHPTAERDQEWDVDSVSDLFHGSFRDKLVPVGVVSIEGSFRKYQTTYQNLSEAGR